MGLVGEYRGFVRGEPAKIVSGYGNGDGDFKGTSSYELGTVVRIDKVDLSDDTALVTDPKSGDDAWIALVDLRPIVEPATEEEIAEAIKSILGAE